jgi:hypothetical protein
MDHRSPEEYILSQAQVFLTSSSHKHCIQMQQTIELSLFLGVRNYNMI